MGFGDAIVNAIHARQDHKKTRDDGPYGDFHRSGGNDLLYKVPVDTGGLVVDAGGFKGEWTSGMLIRYGCRCEVFEPVPVFANICRSLFERNSLVRVHTAALGGSERTMSLSLAQDGTSAFGPSESGNNIEAPVVDVSQFFNATKDQTIACLKLNIEGGEYEVLEKLILAGQIGRCKCILVQFHRQPVDWEQRRNAIEVKLRETHDREWCHPMIWEKWVRKDG